MSKLIKMLVSMAGPSESYAPGDILLVSDEVAESWSTHGIADIHEEQPQKVKEYVPDLTPATNEPPQMEEQSEPVGGDVNGAETSGTDATNTADPGPSENIPQN